VDVERPSETQPALFWAVFVLALGLRLVLLGQHAFHMDEALYASHAERIAHGDLLLTGGLNNDKPPLQAYLGALGIACFGKSESAVRGMDAAMSAAECGLLAWALAPFAGAMAALGAGLLLAASPLHRGYGASGIMDGPLAFFLTWSFVLAVRGRLFSAGLAWGLAFASKQTALLLPWPLLALPFSGLGLRQALLDWLRGALWVALPLLLWSAVFAHPRLGTFLGMAAHQPEVGLHWQGWLDRFGGWLALAQDALPWPKLTAPLILAGPLLSLGLLWRARSAASRAWALLPWVPGLSLGIFAALNMRSFDRYALPYLAPLCAGPALLAAAFPLGSRARRWMAVFSLALGLAAFAVARQQPLSPEQQGAAGDRFDGYRAALLDAKALEPEGASLFCGEGGLRWMGAWYLGRNWKLWESPAEILGDSGLYALARQGTALPQGWNWRPLKVYDSQGRPPYMVLYRTDRG
jgi:4-amino-4-deoxy-L-arabinose transferase-like glycosyltransferase